MKDLIKKLLREGLEDTKSVKGFKYEVYDPEDYTLLIVDINKLNNNLNPHSNLSHNTSYRMDDRIDKAKMFIKSYEKNGVPPGDMIPTYIKLQGDELKILDGRHRIAALYELGYNDVGIQVPNEQVDQIVNLLR